MSLVRTLMIVETFTATLASYQYDNNATQLVTCSISHADDFEKTGFKVLRSAVDTFCLHAFSVSGSLMNKNATNLKVKFL